LSGTVTISLPGHDEYLRRLARWLRDEDELRGVVNLAQRPIREGDMGGALDSVVVAVSSGGVATVLVSSLFAWLTRRSELRAVRLRILTDDGREVELECGSAADADRIAGSLRAVLNTEARQ
jgi:Effector Associated Constant Component 1